jgi:hypothetical protein
VAEEAARELGSRFKVHHAASELSEAVLKEETPSLPMHLHIAGGDCWQDMLPPFYHLLTTLCNLPSDRARWMPGRMATVRRASTTWGRTLLPLASTTRTGVPETLLSPLIPHHFLVSNVMNHQTSTSPSSCGTRAWANSVCMLATPAWRQSSIPWWPSRLNYCLSAAVCSDNEDRAGLTTGSMWYDSKTNGSWAVAERYGGI